MFAHNLLKRTGLAGAVPPVLGNFRGPGNLCDEEPCPGASPQRRRFYLTTTLHSGAVARRACDVGFHMASIWEILDPTQLEYDTSRGVVTEDSGVGPPTSRGGWVRTGKPSDFFSSAPGGASCAGYTTTNGAGTTVSLPESWDTSASDLRLQWWLGDTRPCVDARRVWCVEH